MSPSAKPEKKPEKKHESDRPGRHDSGPMLYWWSVRERPGVGRQMMMITLIWFLSVVAVMAVIGVIVAVTR